MIGIYGDCNDGGDCCKDRLVLEVRFDGAGDRGFGVGRRSVGSGSVIYMGMLGSYFGIDSMHIGPRLGIAVEQQLDIPDMVEVDADTVLVD